jgi:hypothetical protein
MVSGVATIPVGVVGHQGDTGERGDMTGSHQHLRSYAARTLYPGVDHVDATFPTLASSRTMERRPGPFCPTVDVGGRPAYVCTGCRMLLVVFGVCLLLHLDY